MLDIALLGTGGMMPLPNRALASCVVRQDGRLLIIDCGEGTQVGQRALGWGFKNIDVICFTHFHADHISGLAGMLLTIGHAERTEPVTLIGPIGLREIAEALLIIVPELDFSLRFIELDPAVQQQLTASVFDISVCPANHRGACLSYSVSLSRNGLFDVERAKKLPIPIQKWSRLQAGENVEYEGAVYTPDMVMGNPRKGIKFTYITDTRPTEQLTRFAENSDLLVCEGLYAEDELLPKAAARRHMVFGEAAALAKKANACEMWLTHYSPSLACPKAYLEYARRVFPNTRAGFDGKWKSLAYED